MIRASSFTLATLHGQRGWRNIKSRCAADLASSLRPIAIGAGDHLPALFAYAANRPIPITTAAHQTVTSVQVKQRRSARGPPSKFAVALSGLPLFNCLSILSDLLLSCKPAALLQALALVRPASAVFAVARPAP